MICAYKRTRKEPFIGSTIGSAIIELQRCWQIIIKSGNLFQYLRKLDFGFANCLHRHVRKNDLHGSTYTSSNSMFRRNQLYQLIINKALVFRFVPRTKQDSLFKKSAKESRLHGSMGFYGSEQEKGKRTRDLSGSTLNPNLARWKSRWDESTTRAILLAWTFWESHIDISLHDYSHGKCMRQHK